MVEVIGYVGTVAQLPLKWRNLMEDKEGRIYFEYQFAEQHPKISVTLSPESTLTDVLASFQDFLRCSGYAFEGDIVIEYPVENIKEEE
jgi:hypothetical protein